MEENEGITEWWDKTQVERERKMGSQSPGWENVDGECLGWGSMDSMDYRGVEEDKRRKMGTTSSTAWGI